MRFSFFALLAALGAVIIAAPAFLTTTLGLTSSQFTTRPIRRSTSEPLNISSLFPNAATVDSRQYPALVLLCDQHDFQGNCKIQNAINTCTRFDPLIDGHVKSLLQAQGQQCRYWPTDDCSGETEHTVDSKDAPYVWPELDNFEWEWHSFDCIVPSPGKEKARQVQLGVDEHGEPIRMGRHGAGANKEAVYATRS